MIADRSRRKGLRVVVHALLALSLAYLGITALAWFAQSHLIYPAPPLRNDIPAGFDRIRYTTADGLELVAGYRAVREGRPTILFFHGNGANWQSSAMVTARLADAGYGVLAAEYRGYEGNPGTPSEAGLYRDGRAALAFLREQRELSAEDIVLVGNSLGSGVATQIATEFTPRALVLISPFDSMEETVSRKLPWLPVRLLLRDRYRNDAKLPAITAPVLILHGDADTLIVLEQAQALAAVREDTDLVVYPGWGHDLVVHEAVQQRIIAFLDGLPS